MHLSKDEIRKVWNADKKREHKSIVVFCILTVFIFLFSLCFRYNAFYYNDKFVPMQYLKCLKTAFVFVIQQWTGTISTIQKNEVIEALNAVNYYGAIQRLRITYMAFVSGAALAIAGAIFQTVYKNPMASPNILGATAGVNLGNVIMITLYSTTALDLVVLRYEYCYGLAAICVVLVLFLGKLAGDRKGNPSVMKMVMAGSIISQGINVFTMYFMYELTDENLELYQQLNLGTYLQTDFTSILIFSIVMAVSVIPMLFIKYRFNAVAIDALEARTMGINPRTVRVVGQLCGVLMVTAASIHCGEIGMVTMVVPYIVRKFVGADFKKVFIISALTGANLVMICRLLSSMIDIGGEQLPVTFILNIILTPVFVIILAKQK